MKIFILHIFNLINSAIHHVGGTLRGFWLPASHSEPIDIFPFHRNGTSQS